MRVSDSHRLLFVHVQKTGGVTMEGVLTNACPDLRSPCRRHDTLAAILRKERGLSGYWIVGFVRNPWDRMVSWYSMVDALRGRAAEGDRDANRQLTSNKLWAGVAKYPDFATFVEHGPEQFNQLRRPQVAYLTTDTRRADFIGRTESYDADLRAVKARLGIPLDEAVPRVNASSHGDYREYYTDALRRRVGEVFRRDVDAFGYEF